MNISDAAQYQPLLDSLDAGTVTFTDAIRAKAVIERLIAYLQTEAGNVNNLLNSPDAQSALLASGPAAVVSQAVAALKA